jgi:hypothetical protein
MLCIFWAMNSPQYMATALPTVDIYWIQKLLHKNVTLQLCGMRSPLHSQLYYSDVMSHPITMCHPVSRWVETRPFNQPAQYHIRELQWPSAPCTLFQDAAQPPSVTFSSVSFLVQGYLHNIMLASFLKVCVVFVFKQRMESG